MTIAGFLRTFEKNQTVSRFDRIHGVGFRLLVVIYQQNVFFKKLKKIGYGCLFMRIRLVRAIFVNPLALCVPVPNKVWCSAEDLFCRQKYRSWPCLKPIC